MTHDSSLTHEIYKAERRWQREFGGEVSRRPSWAEAWLHAHTPLATPSSGGFATFHRDGGSWRLYRVWLEASRRRQGIISGIWPVWQERYGAFLISLPNQHMQTFLRARGGRPDDREWLWTAGSRESLLTTISQDNER